MAKKPDYRVTTPDPSSEGNYLNVGVAWNGQLPDGTGVINVRINVLPVGGFNGRLTLLPPKNGD